MQYLRHRPATAIAILLSAIYLSIEFLKDVNVLTILSTLLDLLATLEPYQIDDLLVVGVLIGGGLTLDALITNRRRKHALAIHDQRLRVFKATMRTVQDLVNNALNNLQLVRLEAETILSPESLALFDQLIQDTAAKLQVLGDIEDPLERPMASGVGIAYPERATEQGHSSGGSRDAT
jgi:hypothetical protein